MREIAHAERSKYPLSFILCDIDYFKKVNDSYGHVTGDAVLIHTVNLFKMCLRSTDFLARYGGEEFAFILPNTDKNGARQVAERLRSTVKDTPLKDHNKAISLTCSFGLTSYDPKCDNYEKIIQRADSALYKAKDKGRNMVVSLP